MQQRAVRQVGLESTLGSAEASGWLLSPAGPVTAYEIRGASDWVRLAATYPARGAQYACVVNWPAVARDFEAVHLSMIGALATQGIAFPGPDGHIAPPYFDAESTLWTRWVFDRVNRRTLGAATL